MQKNPSALWITLYVMPVLPYYDSPNRKKYIFYKFALANCDVMSYQNDQLEV